MGMREKKRNFSKCLHLWGNSVSEEFNESPPSTSYYMPSYRRFKLPRSLRKAGIEVKYLAKDTTQKISPFCVTKVMNYE